MELIEYKNLEWYVMKESSKKKLLLLKECFTNEMIKKYFDEYDSYFDVKFNQDPSKIWWKDSYIRKILNERFMLDLNINDLNLMKTTLSLNGVISETEDYVRLLTIEEARYLKKQEESILYTKRQYGYWTMSPCYFSSIARVFYVYGSSYPGYLYNGNVSISYGVRPVISLKSETLKSNTMSDEEFKREFSKYLSL